MTNETEKTLENLCLDRKIKIQYLNKEGENQRYIADYAFEELGKNPNMVMDRSEKITDKPDLFLKGITCARCFEEYKSLEDIAKITKKPIIIVADFSCGFYSHNDSNCKVLTYDKEGKYRDYTLDHKENIAPFIEYLSKSTLVAKEQKKK